MTDRETETMQTIDAALAAGRPTAHDQAARELQELALILAAESPDPSEHFAAAMDDRLANGFEADAGSGPEPHRRSPLAGIVDRLRGASLPTGRSLAGALAAALLALAVVAGVGIDQLRSETTEPTTVTSGASEPMPSAPEAENGGRAVADADELTGTSKMVQETSGLTSSEGDLPGSVEPSVIDIAPAPPGKRGEALGETDRRVERSAFMTIAAPTDELAEAGNRIAGVATRNDGFVLNASLTTGEEGTRGGFFELRVPVDRLDTALTQLGDIGAVRALTQDERDVTAGFESIEERLDEANAERRGLIRRLGAAGTETEAAAIRRQLKRVNRTIANVRDDHRRFDRHVSYAAISVSLEKGSREDSGALERALDDAGSILVALAGFALRGLAVLVPLGLVALAAYSAARVVRRRRRESALD